MSATTMVCDCGHEPTPQKPGSCATGYGYDPDGRTLCYPCCAESTRARMIETGRGDLYLSDDGRSVTDWPGFLRFPVLSVKPTTVGFLKHATIAYFVGPDGARWSARGGGRGMWARARRLK